MSSPDQLGGVTPGPEAAQAPDMFPAVDPEAVRAAEERAAQETLAWDIHLSGGGLAVEGVKVEGTGDREEVDPILDVDPLTLEATAQYLVKKPNDLLLSKIRERREARERRLAEETAAEAERVRRQNLGLKDDEPLPPLPTAEDDGAIAFKGKYTGRTRLSRGNDQRVFAQEGLNPDGTEPVIDEPAADESVAA